MSGDEVLSEARFKIVSGASSLSELFQETMELTLLEWYNHERAGMDDALSGALGIGRTAA